MKHGCTALSSIVNIARDPTWSQTPEVQKSLEKAAKLEWWDDGEGLLTGSFA
jgi:hypothetical protein